MPVSVEKWTADGWNLEAAGVRGWEYRAGTDRVAAPVGSNGQVPNRRGELWRAKTLGAGSFTLGMWLAGTSRDECYAQYGLLLQAVVRPHRLVRIERTMADGSVRWCDAEYAGGIEPTHIAQRGMKAAIDFKVPDGVWRAKDPMAAVSTIAGSALPQTLALPLLAGNTAAVEDGTITVYGPITSALVVDRTDGVDGDTLLYDTPLTSGQYATFDGKAWTVTGGGSHVAKVAKVFPSGRRFLTVPAPRPGATPTIQLRGTGGGAATKLTYTAYPTFAC